MADIAVTLKNGEKRCYPVRTSLLDISRDMQHQYKSPIVAAYVDHEERSLNVKLNKKCSINFVELKSPVGLRIYSRTLILIMQLALNRLNVCAHFSVKNNIGDNIYCELAPTLAITDEFIEQLKDMMQKIIQEDIAIEYHRVPIEKARRILAEYRQEERLGLIEYIKRPYITFYKCQEAANYFFSPLLPQTSYIKVFDVQKYQKGILLRYPNIKNVNKLEPFKDRPKLFKVFVEAEKWGELIGCDSIADLNRHINDDDFDDIIRVAEALHEKKIAQIADFICEQGSEKRIILIAGPSSSGKTTFSHRLNVQLKVNGLKPVNISIDDYFVNRDESPRKPNGDFDFENIETIDLALFNEHLLSLLNGECVKLPTFNFILGCREYRGNSVCIADGQPLIIEGIHALNDKLTKKVPSKYKTKIYVSAITGMALDEYNRMRTTDCRLLRRIVRDSQFRAHDARQTIKMWSDVRAGEEKNIFPYQEKADIMFNTALIYELAVLKKYAIERLEAVKPNQEEYAEAIRLINLLEHVKSINNFTIPANSILKEFIG